MRRYLLVLMVVLVPVATGSARATENLFVTRHSAVMLHGDLNLTCRWVAANPVSTIRVTVASQEKSVAVDPGLNRRTANGFEGAATASVPVEAGAEAITYAVVLADGQGNLSNQVTGKLAVKRAEEGSRGIGSVAADDAPPSLGRVRVNKLEGNLVSFSAVATDDKGLSEVRFRVLDSQGRQVKEFVFNGLGKHWEGTTERFILPVGSYTVVAKAVGSSGNASPEQRSPFGLYDPPRHTWKVSVRLDPMEAAGKGAMWQLDGGPWQGSNGTVYAVPGTHLINFKDAAGWRAPAPVTISVPQGGLTTLATYEPDSGAQSRGLSDGGNYRLVRIPAAASDGETRGLVGQGGYYLKITSQGGLGDVDRIAEEVASKVGGEVVDPGALDQTRSAFGDSARRDASIEIKAQGDSRFPFVAAIDLFCYGTSLFKLNLCKNSADVASKVASAIGGVVTKVYDVYNTVFGQPPEGSQETPKQDAEAPPAQ